MRRIMLVFVAGSVAACANDVTAPTTVPTPENSLTAVTADSAGPWRFGHRGFGMMSGLMFARQLPPDLQLSDAQRTQIRSLMSAYRTAHEGDLASLASVAKQAHAARTSGTRMTVDQRRALFAPTAPARQRLFAANKTLRGDIRNVLTGSQKAWLASHRPTLRRTNASTRRWTNRNPDAGASNRSANY